MPSRVRLTFNRNQDQETEYYNIYRDTQPNINHRDSRDKMVMKILHPKHINPITMKNEILKRETDNTYSLIHRNVLIDHNNVSYPFIIKVDEFERTDFLLDMDEGKITFDNPISATSIVKCIEYTFDGVQVWDYEKIEDGKVYYGPEAKDTSAPNPPQNITLEKDLARNRIIIRWTTSTLEGQMLYYRVDAAIDEQRYSKLSEVKHAFLRESLADRPYIVERSDDGVRWVEIAKVAGNEYYEYSIDRHAPSAIQNLKYFVVLDYGGSKGQITLRWNKILDDIASTTSMYRIRAKNKIGMVSMPSEVVGPIQLKVGVKHIIIRRKIDDGTLPSYNGTDAQTIATITDVSITEFVEVLPDNKTYMYGMWVVDEAGNYSTIAIAKVYVGDATAPATPINITAEEFPIVLG